MNKVNIINFNPKANIVEKKLHIPADYQYKALNDSSYIKSNWHANKLYVLNKHLNLGKSDRVMDLGTGSGNFEFEFAKKVRQIIGVDYNDQALKFLYDKLKAKKITNVLLIQSDIKELKKLRKGKFDVVVLSDVIEHLKLNDAKQIVKEISKKMKKGEVVSIITPNYDSMWTYLEKFLDFTGLVPKFDQEQHLSKFNVKLLNKIFKLNKFKEKKVFTFNLFSPLLPTKQLSCLGLDIEEKLIGNSGNLIFALYEFRG